jgi:hypothetical protein
MLCSFGFAALALIACAAISCTNGVVLGKSAHCRNAVRKNDAKLIGECCTEFNIGCDSPVIHKNDIPVVQLGRELDHRPVGRRLIGLGGLCNEKLNECSSGLECRGGLCRRIGLAKEALKKSVAMQTESKVMDGGTGSDVEVSDPLAKSEGIKVHGLSVPVSARIRIEDVITNRPHVHGTLHYKAKDTQEAMNEAESQSSLDAGNKTCEESSLAVSSGQDEARQVANDMRKEHRDRMKMGEVAEPNMNETEEEVISDSVAQVVRQMTGKKLNKNVLRAMDAAVAKTMSKYEQRQMTDMLEQEAKRVAEKEVPPMPDDTQDVTTVQIGSTQEAMSSDPEQLKRQLEQTVTKSLRDKLLSNISVTMLDKIVNQMILGARCTGQTTKTPFAPGGPDDIPCDTIRWLRANWFATKDRE